MDDWEITALDFRVLSRRTDVGKPLAFTRDVLASFISSMILASFGRQYTGGKGLEMERGSAQEKTKKS